MHVSTVVEHTILKSFVRCKYLIFQVAEVAILPSVYILGTQKNGQESENSDTSMCCDLSEGIFLKKLGNMLDFKKVLLGHSGQSV